MSLLGVPGVLCDKNMHIPIHWLTLMQSSSLYKINLHDPILFHQGLGIYDIVRTEFQDIVLGKL